MKTPDGFSMVVSTSLPKDHWIYEKSGEPPAPLRIGICDRRERMANRIAEAARYAIRGATMSGKAMDFDPDAMVKNFIVGMLGYWSVDGK